MDTLFGTSATIRKALNPINRGLLSACVVWGLRDAVIGVSGFRAQSDLGLLALNFTGFRIYCKNNNRV